MTFDANGNVTIAGTPINQYQGMKNRIINGDMRIDQRFAGTANTVTTSAYSLDRWATNATQSSKYSFQQNAGSITPPVGFTNYLGITSLSSYSLSSTDWFTLQQGVEGYNISDLSWGTSSARPVTLSFWVRSSLTGLFGGSLSNSDVSRSYAYTYTINTPNTWQYVSMTIPGDTIGTWLTNNGVGIRVYISLGCGTSQSTTANVWSSGFYNAPAGNVSVVGTNGATFYITGVQLEVGTTATAFERRHFGTEMTLCQRYFSKSYDIGTIPGTATQVGLQGGAFQGASGLGGAYGAIQYPVAMRAAPSITLWDGAGSSNVLSYTYGAAGSAQSILNGGALWGAAGAFNIGTTSFFFRPTGAQASSLSYVHYTASSEL